LRHEPNLPVLSACSSPRKRNGHLCGLSRQRANQALQVLAKAGILEAEYDHITFSISRPCAVSAVDCRQDANL